MTTVKIAMTCQSDCGATYAFTMDADHEGVSPPSMTTWLEIHNHEDVRNAIKMIKEDMDADPVIRPGE